MFEVNKSVDTAKVNAYALQEAAYLVNMMLAKRPDVREAMIKSGAQLCETVPWSQFRYRPTVQGGHPVQVKTEVEVRFEPRK